MAKKTIKEVAKSFIEKTDAKIYSLINDLCKNRGEENVSGFLAGLVHYIEDATDHLGIEVTDNLFDLYIGRLERTINILKKLRAEYDETRKS